MKKIIKLISIIGIMLLVLTGCTTSKTYTFKVDNGDKIKVKLNTSEGHDLSSNVPFIISKDGATLSQGTFIQESYYDTYVDTAKSNSLSTVLDSGSNDDIEYIFYSYNDEEWNYIIKVKNSNTGIVLANGNSEEEAKKCFGLLNFSLE